MVGIYGVELLDMSKLAQEHASLFMGALFLQPV
jgi:hypothetical protein